jgi:vancomycin permeability regulator SanA
VAPTSDSIPDAVCRGLALFLGGFSLAGGIAALGRGTPTQNVWWIDLSSVPVWLAGAFSIAAAALLIAWALHPRISRGRSVATALALAALAITAGANSIAFYVAWRAGTIAPLMPIPASLVYAAVFVLLGLRVVQASRAPSETSSLLGVIGAAVVLALVFPLLQIAFFGTTDYRRSADAAVVLGAQVYPGGALSTALEDRVRTGVDLYNAGLVPRLVMSGGTGVSGVDESLAMKRRAIELGVPDAAVMRDPKGDNTDATVANTTAMLGGAGSRRVLVVSQFWHLPRVKLAYRKAGWDVYTVPASASTPIPQTPYLMLREIPAFWQYWARSL